MGRCRGVRRTAPMTYIDWLNLWFVHGIAVLCRRSALSKPVLVTGGSRGIGAATALLAAGQAIATRAHVADEAQEVAGAIVWPLSEQAGYTTGALLDIAGGC
jgi:NAD(P)-dependent dehydrogenase (short-subunit alcohol dehydrogenase family)